MSVEYVARIPSNEQYGYYEVRADAFAELQRGEAEVRDWMKNEGTDFVQDKAVQTLENNGLRTSLPGLNKPKFGGNKPAEDDSWKGKELGEVDGNVITYHETGKYGPYFKAYNKADKSKQFANAPKGMAPHQATLEAAIEAFNG